MSNEIQSKLASLKTLRGEMKDWKKDDIKKKKGIKDPEPKEQAKTDEPSDTLARLISKLVKE